MNCNNISIYFFHSDIDECSLGISACHGKSVCINTPGWYRCDCLEGYHSSWPDNHYGSLCMGEYLSIFRIYDYLKVLVDFHMQVEAHNIPVIAARIYNDYMGCR